MKHNSFLIHWKLKHFCGLMMAIFNLAIKTKDCGFTVECKYFKTLIFFLHSEFSLPSLSQLLILFCQMHLESGRSMKEELWHAIVFLALFNITNDLGEEKRHFLCWNKHLQMVHCIFFKEVFWYTCHWNKSVRINWNSGSI